MLRRRRGAHRAGNPRRPLAAEHPRRQSRSPSSPLGRIREPQESTAGTRNSRARRTCAPKPFRLPSFAHAPAQHTPPLSLSLLVPASGAAATWTNGQSPCPPHAPPPRCSVSVCLSLSLSRAPSHPRYLPRSLARSLSPSFHPSIAPSLAPSLARSLARSLEIKRIGCEHARILLWALRVRTLQCLHA